MRSLAEVIKELLYGENGYYTKYVKIGKRGDFFTAPHASPMFGYTVGRFLEREGVRSLVEVGGGEGYLALDILNFTRMKVFSYERSPRLREIQRKLLRRYEDVGRWETVDDLVRADAYLLNEVLDAFPVRRYVFREGRWWEVMERDGEFGLVESEGPQNYDGPVSEGFTYDETVGMGDFLKRIFLSTDRVLIFDYGYDEDEFPLVAPSGTLQGYRNHRAFYDLHALAPGMDITHFINFSHVERLAKESGFDVAVYMDQTNFLLKCGMLDIFAELPEDDKSSLSRGMKTLILLFRNHRVMYLKRKS